MTTVESTAVDDLRARLGGRVVAPSDPDYDALRVVVLGGVDPRPALIVRPADDADVVAAVTFARDRGLPLAVRSGGHSGAGHGTVDDGLVVDLRDLRAVDIDVEDRTAWVGAGATAGEVTAATAAHGLVVGFGDTGSVGVGGITLGGGVGYLSRSHGLTVDNLLAADVVLADGRVVRADAAQHPDLFWALRGGGGNLGVVTRFRFRLHPLGGVTGGILLLPASAEVVAGFLSQLQDAPDELSAIVNVMPCPPMPFVPAEHHGELAVMALVCWSGAPRRRMRCSRRSARWPSRWRTWCGRWPTRSCSRRPTRSTTRRRSRGRCCWTTSTCRSRSGWSSGSATSTGCGWSSCAPSAGPSRAWPPTPPRTPTGRAG
jgi:hypothetical protein